VHEILLQAAVNLAFRQSKIDAAWQSGGCIVGIVGRIITTH